MRSLDFIASGSSEAFVGALSEEALNHTAVNHEYLQRLSSGEFENIDEVLKDYAYQYSFYSMWFPEYVKAVMGTTEDKKVIDALEENLLEELGDPDAEDNSEKPHTEIYKDFKGMIGVNDEYASAHEMSFTVDIWRKLFLQKCGSGSTAVGVGAISLATEYIVPHIYPKIISCIENHTSFDNDSSFFFRLHVECDAEHAEDAIEVAKHLADQSTVNREALRFGVLSALNLRTSFWDNQLARALSMEAR